MEISEVRVKLIDNARERLRAFCSITLDDDFVIRDLKIIEGTNGTFVAMPSRKLADRCPKCGHKNHLRACFCNECGDKLDARRGLTAKKRTKLHADIAHPINSACRERIQSAVVSAYNEELERSKEPGYKPQDVDLDLDGYDEDTSDEAQSSPRRTDPEPQPVSSEKKRDRMDRGSGGGGYDELIAELKRDAAQRQDGREHHSKTSQSGDSSVAASSETAIDTQEDDNADDFGAGIL